MCICVSAGELKKWFRKLGTTILFRTNWENYVFLLLFSLWYHRLISLATRTFPSLCPPPVRPLPLCYRVIPWLWAKWGRAAGVFRGTGLLQRRGTFPKAQQVQQTCYSELYTGKVCSVLTNLL